LLTTAAAVVFAGAMAGSASAFEIVDWNWLADIDEDWNIDVRVQVDYDPTGIVKIEKLQMHFGDVKSFAKVFGIENNPPVTGSGTGTVTVPIDGAGTFDLNYVDPADDDNPNGGPGEVIEFTVIDPTGINLTLDGGQASEDTNTIAGIEYTITGEVEVNLSEIDFGDPIEAAALPEVVNAATSVANNQTIYSTSALMLHDAQIAVGDINDIGGREPEPAAFLLAAYGLTLVDDELEGLNEHTESQASWR
jgi:hypothetical protein